MGTLIRLVLGIAVALAIATIVGVAVMGGVARTQDVKEIPVPETSHLAGMKADYSDAFRTPLEYNTYRSIDRLAETVFRNGGREIMRSDTEIVYEGNRAGVHYYNAWYLDRTVVPNTLTLVTAVHVTSAMGRAAWTCFKPIHKGLAPYQLNRLASGAPD